MSQHQKRLLLSAHKSAASAQVLRQLSGKAKKNKNNERSKLQPKSLGTVMLGVPSEVFEFSLLL